MIMSRLRCDHIAFGYNIMIMLRLKCDSIAIDGRYTYSDLYSDILYTYYIYTRPLARQGHTGKTIDKTKGNGTVMSDRVSIVSEPWHLWQKYWTDRGKQISTNDYRACTEVDKQ